MNIAVILAAGLGSRFGDITKYVPKGMIKVGKEPMIQTSIENLQACGYSEILLVTGHCSSVYDNFVKRWSNVKTIKNPFYSTAGSLFSLYLALSEVRKYKFSNLTILESDIIYDGAILKTMPTNESCMVISKPKEYENDDECWVELQNGYVSKISKNPKDIRNPEYEMVGITNIAMNTILSSNNYEVLLYESLDLLSKNNLDDYERLITKMGNFKGIPTTLAWAEIDNTKHLEYAAKNILPII